LGVTPPPVANKPNDITLCETSPGTTTANFNIAAQTPIVLGSQSPTIYDVSYYRNAADANTGLNPISTASLFTTGNTTVFVRMQNTTDPNCFSTTNFRLTVIPRPVLDQRINQFVCGSYTLPPLVNPGNYYSGPNQGLPVLSAGDVISTDQIIYLYNTTSTTPSCPVESSFSVKIVTPVEADPTDIIVCDQYTLPFTAFSLRYFSLPVAVERNSQAELQFPALEPQLYILILPQLISLILVY
jgi:hypothetical protein